MPIIKKTLWFDTQGDGSGFEKLEEAIKRRLSFILTRSSKESAEQAIVNNRKEIVKLLQQLDDECHGKPL